MQNFKLIKELTLQEKAKLVAGKNFWETADLKEQGFPSVMMTDGPHGLRKQEGDSDHLGINKSVEAVSFPTAATSACSFDRELLYKMGEALGDKCLREKVAVILGPGVNMKRSPLCGRNFEYFSEDPCLAGEMGAALVNGVQSRGVGTSLKHFAGNNQEHARMVCDSVIDERALREIYLRAFETVVKKAKPWTVMCSYNKLNGTFASDHKWLLQDVLRKEWGYEGLVVSDWGANNDRIRSIQAGMDLEMPYSGKENEERICDAVKSGKLAEEDLNICAERVAQLIKKATTNSKTPQRTDEEDHQLAAEIAVGSMVLLKNENVLPLREEEEILFVGDMAQKPRYQGAGSSKINPCRLDSAYQMAQKQGYHVDFARGYAEKSNEIDHDLFKEAFEKAKKADKVVIFVGLPDEYESEGFDRSNMKMPECHNRLIAELSSVNKQIIVVLQCGSPVELPWKTKVQGILLSYLAGEASGQATVDLLWGKENPSGRLAETWPESLLQNPSYAFFPQGPKAVEYRESLFIGYRYYDQVSCKLNYPFGFGLSYTDFTYRMMEAKELRKNTFEVSVLIENTGSYPGREVVQLYVEKQDSAIIRARKELKNFTKITLQPGEKKLVTLDITEQDFEYYNVKAGSFCIEGGSYQLGIAKSASEILLSEEVMVEGDGKEELLQEDMKQLTNYRSLSLPLHISEEQFTLLLGRKPPLQERNQKEPFTPESTIADIQGTLIGAVMRMLMKREMKNLSTENADIASEKMEEEMMMATPFRSMTMTGVLNLTQIDGIVEMANGHYLRGLRKMMK